MKSSSIIKRSIVIHDRKSSVSVEDIFWISLKEIAKFDHMTLSDLVGLIETSRAPGSNLSSAIRVHVLARFKSLAQVLAPLAGVPGTATQPHGIAVTSRGRAFGLGVRLR